MEKKELQEQSRNEQKEIEEAIEGALGRILVGECCIKRGASGKWDG